MNKDQNSKIFRFNPRSSVLATAILMASAGSLALEDVSGFQADSCGAGGCNFSDTGNLGEVSLSQNNSSVSFDKFSLKSFERVDFNGAASGWSVLVNVTGGQSNISGALGGNVGRLVLVNPNGIVFDGANIIDIKQLVATTGTITGFGTGQYTIANINPNTKIEVKGQGLTSSVTDAQIALIAGDIDISGKVTVSSGDFIAAAGGTVLVNIDNNNGLMSVDITKALQASGTAISISNTGEITAENIELNAKISSDPLSFAINQRGLLKATGVVNEGGVIKILAKGAKVLSLGTLDTSDADGEKVGSVEIDATTVLLSGRTTTNLLDITVGEDAVEGQLKLIENNSLALDVNHISVAGLGATNVIDGLANYTVSGIDSGTAGYEGVGTDSDDFSNVGAITFNNVTELKATKRTDNTITILSGGSVTGAISGGAGNNDFLVQGTVAELNGLDGSDNIMMDGGFIQSLDGGGGEAGDVLLNVIQPTFDPVFSSSGTSINVAHWKNIEAVTEPPISVNVTNINVPQNAYMPIGNLGSAVLGLAGAGDELRMPCGSGSNIAGASANIDKPDCFTKYNTPEYQQLISSLIHFDNNSYALTAASVARLNKISDFVVESQLFDQVVLAGHTDSNASHAYNMRLANKRVNTASTYMQERGVDAGLLKAYAFGETLPVKLNDSNEGRAYNRRVHIELKK